MDFSSLLKTLGGFLPKAQPIASPLPQGEVLDKPVLRNYVANNQAREEAARGAQAPQQNYAPVAPPSIGDIFTDLFTSQDEKTLQGHKFGTNPPAQITPGAPGLNFGGLIQAVKGGIAPSPQPIQGGITPTATPAPQSNIAEAIKRAYEMYNPHAPLATLSGELAAAGEGLPDPFLPAIVGMKESSGGTHMTYPNYPLNILAPGQYDYPTIQSNISGGPGDQRLSFKELLQTNPYADYRASGNVADFFKRYTPDTDSSGNRNSNATIADQVALYNELRRRYFTPQVAQR